MTAGTNSGDPEDALGRARREIHALERHLQERRGEPSRAGERSRGEHALGRLLRIVARLNTELDLERVLGLAAEQVIDIFEAERVFIIDLRPDGEFTFRLTASFRGHPIARPELEVSHAVVRQVADRLEPILVEDAATDERFAEVSSVASLDLHSVMAAPLLAQGELLGVVYADNRLLSGAFDPYSLHLLGVFASHVGIAIRNAELFEQLAATQEQLATAERLRAIGEVGAFVAHRAKNCLASIRILLAALEQRWMEPEVRDRVFTLVPQEINRLSATVNNILGYARPPSSCKDELLLGSVVRSAMAFVAPQLEQAEVDVALVVPDEEPEVLGDGDHLREAFVNLIRNALEAAADSGPKEVRIEVRRSGESDIEVVVEDTGPGIPEDDLTRIFEPFTTHKQGGSGLGLAMCQKVAKEHGGRVLAENRIDGGARFRFVVPVAGS